MSPRLDLSRGVEFLTTQLCDIESVSGRETRLADEIELALITCAHLDVIRDGDVIVARTNLNRGQRVLIAGHIDTVPVHNNLPTQKLTEGGVTYLVGRGTVDMKGGVAVALALAVELTAPRIDVTWVFYDHEEVDASLNGLGRLVKNLPSTFDADFGILCEPTSAIVEGGCNGTIRVDVTARGIRSHSARAWKGDNAIHKLESALSALARFEAPTTEVDGLFYRESLSAVGVRGGVAGNVIPDEATLSVNYRFAPSTTPSDALQFLEDFFVGYEVTLTDAAPGARPGLTSPIATEFIRAVGQPPSAKYGWTDVARLSEMGIPAVNFGPGDPSLAHADDERVDVEQLHRCEQALRDWLA